MKKLSRLIILPLVSFFMMGFVLAQDFVSLPLENVDGATICQIYRKNLNKDKKSWSTLISVFDYDKDPTRVIKDYFINPEDKYTYYFLYQNKDVSGSWKTIKTVTKTITADKGMGEYQLALPLNANYDEENGYMTFNATPHLKKDAQKLLDSLSDYNEKSLVFNLRYNPKGEGFAVFIKNITTTRLDCSTLVATSDMYDPIKLYNKPLVLHSLEIQFCVGDIRYSRYCSDEEEKGLTKVIKVPEKERCLIITPTEKGNEINIPEIEDTAFFVEVNRYIKNNNGEYIIDQNIWLDNWPRNKHKKVIDYFVCENKEYYYQIEAKGDRNEIIFRSSYTPIVSKGGKGEIEVTQAKTSYDEKKAVLKFKSLPKLVKSLQEFEDNYIRIWYSEKSNMNWISLYTNLDKNKVDFTKLDEYEQMAKRGMDKGKFDLVYYEAYINLDNVTYKRQLPKDGLPESIIIPNLAK